MNKNTRLVVSVLFSVIIILAIGITRFYFDVSKDAVNNSSTAEIIRKLDIDSEGNRIFEGSGSLYGVVDSNDRVITAPEWVELEFAGNGICIASKRIGGRLLSGCIDYEGNIITPFIYRNITRYESDGFVIYSAESDSDGSCVIYSDNFTPYFIRSWDSCAVNENQMQLTYASGSFSYTFGENGLVCQKAEVSGEALGCEFMLSIYSRILLSKLDSSMLETISDEVSAYLEYAFSGERSKLGDLADSGDFTYLFPDETVITERRLTGISNIFIYAEKNGTGPQTYAVSVVADAEIDYTDETGETVSFEDSYKAVVRFAETASGISAVSGEFAVTAPEYPRYDPENTETVLYNENEEYSQHNDNEYAHNLPA